jgi:hypothetical protein
MTRQQRQDWLISIRNVLLGIGEQIDENSTKSGWTKEQKGLLREALRKVDEAHDVLNMFKEYRTCPDCDNDHVSVLLEGVCRKCGWSKAEKL